MPSATPSPATRPAGTTSAAVELGGQLARAGLAPPPELDELFRRRAEGAPPAELRRFVRARFPPDLKLRALTLDWLDRHPAR